MELSQIIPHIESLIFAADRPLPLLEILDLLNNALAFLEDRASLEQVETALDAIKEKYSSEFYPFEVRESGGGYQFLTKKEYYQTVAQLNGEKFLKRLSTAALETLAIVAYKQPISKGEIEHIRGVSTDYSIQKLLEKELIVISGRSETLPGKPLLYSTSKAFMDYFGLNSPKDLPKLKEVFEDESIQPTLVGLEGNTESPDEDGLNMVVSETGELVERDLSHDDGPATRLNGHHVDVQEEIPVVDEDIPVKDQEDTEESEPSASGIIPVVVEDIPTMDEEQAKAAEDKEDTEDDAQSTDEDNTPVADDDNVVATEDEIAAFLAAAADLGPKDDDDEDEEDEDDDEDFEDDEDDEDGDEDDEDFDDDEDGEDDDDDVEEDDDDEDSDEDDEDEDDDFDDEEDDEDGDDEEDDLDLEDDEEGGKEEDVDDEGFYKDGDFGDDDDEEDDDDKK
ncbi:SMC-Scp complex subunit ScpB [Chitinophaga filiformis]|uniref:Segregation and condensation protein B n=1 Tax=Chitinophaga filiformis TaxID=104663 RepID=A0A1G7HCV5_CHIFI|nr:SMC-Scp complex subunit ScpB [Chitinophaga filiformis]SDE98245.1 segregation and condensation protein B [Chitinophaga filiformis]